MIYLYRFVCDHESEAGEPFEYDRQNPEHRPFSDFRKAKLEEYRAAHGEHADHAILQCVSVRS